MLYECQDIYVDLARVIAVSEIRFGGGMRDEGGRFNVTLTGIEHGLWIKAPDKSTQAAMALETDREGLLANWRRYKSARPGGEKTVYALGHLHINLLAVSALTGLTGVQHGSYMGGGTPTSIPAYTVYVAGMKEPIVRKVGEAADDGEKLSQERQDLLTAWSAMHSPTLRQGAA